ncbi:MAG: hypothetical protein EB059_08475, partial [Alphaproteobacteria bacterium]|nr:hypothetical protein [Alphaproteobacteria bacterium]
PSSTRFRDEACHGNSLSWLYDRDTLTVNLIQALSAENKKRWFIIKSDDGYSCDLTKTAKKRIRDSGGELVGEAQFGKRMSGLTTILEQAEAVKPDVIFLAFDRPDLLHLLSHWPRDKEAAPIAFTSLYVSDIHALGHKYMPPFYTMSSFYWNQDDTTRAWSNKFAARNRGGMPTDIQASVYSSVRHYLQSVKDIPEPSADIMTRMKAAPLDDMLFGASHIRADGLVAHRLLLLSSTTDQERSKPWDVYKVVRTIQPQNVTLPAQASCNND